MSARIQRLSSIVASQIAAGEVIERPVSVVKELLENALDAKATRIDVEIMDAGFRSIKVSDNGVGIKEEDLLLALEPHCTSKCSTLEDLFDLNTKGFRGEALASMASVARIDLCSRTACQDHAMRLTYEEGLTQLQPSVRDMGTTIEVKDLFFNVPVRKKFLKSHAFEWGAIEALVKRFAVSAPSVHIRLMHHQECVLDLPIAQNSAEHYARIKKIWGKSFENAHEISIDRCGLSLSGWLGDLTEHRSQNDRLWVFLNGRIVQDKLIQHALKQVYMSYLPTGRHPQCVLYLQTPPGMVDINVHPAKQEVRFEQPRLIYDFVMSALKPYWQQNVAANEKQILSPLSTEFKVDGFQSPVALSWTICNAEYIVISKIPHQYLIDVERWWFHHLHQMLKNEKGAWRPRSLMMPYVHTLKNYNEKWLLAVIDVCQSFGIDMQLWGENNICIRSIPEILPHFNIKTFCQLLNQMNNLEDLSISSIVRCCTFSAYDMTVEMYHHLLADLEQGSGDDFARVLDLDLCRKIFR